MAEASECIMCIEPIAYYGIGPCNHRQVCAKCTLRMTVFYNGTVCPTCRTEYGTVVVTSSPTVEHAACVNNPRFVPDSAYPNTLFESQNVRRDFRKLVDLYCNASADCAHSVELATKPFKSLKALRSHLQKVHGSFLCNLCYSAGTSFKVDLEVFPSKRKLTAHRAMHPRCGFCQSDHLDDESLLIHLQDNHELCNLCDERLQYFESRESLAEHYRHEHFPCPHNCNGGLSAFRTEFDLKAHLLEVHAAELSRAERNRLRHLDVFSEPAAAPSTRATGPRPRSVQAPGAIPTGRTPPPLESFPTLSAVASRSSAPPPSSRGASSTAAQSRPSMPGSKVTPETYRARNKAMIVRIKKALNNDADLFAQFKELSKLYRNSKIDVDTYYNQFVGIFGAAKANVLLTDLIATLPNAEKRAELAAYHKANVAPFPTDMRAGPDAADSSSRSSNWSRRAGGSANAGAAPPRPSDFPTLATEAPATRPSGSGRWSYRGPRI